ncbi:MAG: hypothetical protein ACRDL3_02230 [Solirubrobacterales bacterium]
MTAGSHQSSRGRTYLRVAGLPLMIESYELEGLERPWSPEFTRLSTVVRLRGAGLEGVGEDVTYTPQDHVVFQSQGVHLPLAGSYTLASFAARLDDLDLFPVGPQRNDSRAHRLWAFESAAVDLALRQAGLSLAAALEREPAPLSFVVSLRLPEPPGLEPVLSRLALYPGMRFKLDATASWDEGLIAELRATGAIGCVDFKGYYEGTPVDSAADAGLYERVATGLPGVWLEDPARTPETEAVIAAHVERVTWDAPIGSVADVASLPVRPRMVNVKPSRFGTLRGVLDAYDYLAVNSIDAYGGGQFELGPGRGQIQYLAALFHPAAPNDVAPGGFHEVRAGLPVSPLVPGPPKVGFGWD